LTSSTHSTTRTGGGWIPRSLSAVVPVFDEEENVVPLVEGILAVLRELDLSVELIIVDDGSRDQTLQRLMELVPANPELVVIEFSTNCGQTQALQAGFDRARGDAIVTLDGDLQNDPQDIPMLLGELRAGADVVSGWRRDRQDALVVRKLPSWAANWLIRTVTGVPIHDQGCSLKAYRREIIEGLDLYGEMHRFIGVVTMPHSAVIREVEVRHHPRIAGESKYGLSRILKVIADLFTIQTIIRFRENPIRTFAWLGLPFLAAGTAFSFLLIFGSSFVVPVATMSVMLSTFVACALFGLLANWVVGSAPRETSRTISFRELGESS